jgi:ABC-type taurine transport system substrate-binding protein
MLIRNLESFIVGGRDMRGPGLSAGDMSLPRDLHYRRIQTPFIVQSGSQISMTSLHHFGNDPHQRTIL